ncbi:unnamed protein product [Peronospora destructor]|uniref:Protein phosphatase n=1 Tax=Peronospora destructor TaxID=86335 RepID=A0AAV0U409_9STRA|nr:unnamed protein product [Peronospora destructor]
MPRALLSPPSVALSSMHVCDQHSPRDDDKKHSIWLNPTSAIPVPTQASRFSTCKRRAKSLGDLFSCPQTSPVSRNALANAFQMVSSKTHQKLAKLRSQSDIFMKRSTLVSHNGWNLKVNNPIRRATPVVCNHRYKWGENHLLQHAQTTFEWHGEDAGSASCYFHIVADGVSSPFGRQSLADYDGVPVSSAILAREVVTCVRLVLEEVTSHNREPVDQTTFEAAIVDAIKTARISCFQYRKSRLATTLIVSYFNRWTGTLLTFSLGDSKCLVVRRGSIIYETLAVLREFNMPTVVNLREQVVPKDYVVQSFALQKGDVCLTFSDGLGDNLYKDDITTVFAMPELLESGLQSVCDQLVNMSKVHEKMPVVRDNRGCQDLLYPFATAAVLEYRKRTLEETKRAAGGPLDVGGVDHMALSLELTKKHKGKQTLGRHLLLRRPSRKHHYSLMQLRLMALMPTKKPDDITLFMTHFV